MSDWEIRKLEYPVSMEEIEEFQNVIWPGSERDIVPVHILLAASHNGGLVLGAYARNVMIGMLFGFPGVFTSHSENKLKHCSHMLEVHPEWRNSGLGFALKCAHRQFVLSQELNLVTWTYDPLLSRNAYLNINKHGAVCNTYRQSEFGQMLDAFNAGLDSDRFQVDWWLDSSRVERRLNNRKKHPKSLDVFLRLDVEILAISGDMQPPSGFPKIKKPMLLIEIPYDFLTIKSADFSLAKA